jgi:hypothetical protein
MNNPSKYLQEEGSPVTRERPIYGFKFDSESDRGMVRDVHIRDFSWSKGSGGTPNFPINAGSAALTTSGDFAVQTHSGSAILTVKSGTSTYYFTCAGTL